jgi:hypothetical protein
MDFYQLGSEHPVFTPHPQLSFDAVGIEGTQQDKGAAGPCVGISFDSDNERTHRLNNTFAFDPIATL